jgi:hypothetical protein
VDNPETRVSELIAPSSPLGDLRGNNGGTLRFDGKVLEALDRYWSEGEGMNYGTITVSGPAGSVAIDVVSGVHRRLAPPTDAPLVVTAGDFVGPPVTIPVH